MNLSVDEIRQGLGTLRVSYEGITGVLTGYRWDHNLARVELDLPHGELTIPLRYLQVDEVSR